MDWSSFSIGNAAGFIKGPGKLFDEMLRSAATDIKIGSITIRPRDGNTGNVYHYDPESRTSINALGLPNGGLEETLTFAEEMNRRTREAGKKLWWSVAGFNPEEYLTLSEELFPFGSIELNLGCPNVWGDTGQKEIASFNLELIRSILQKIFDYGEAEEIRVKLSPYSDPSMITAVAKVIKAYDEIVAEVVTCNTFPNGIAFDDGKPILNTPGGYGGVAGNAIQSIALGQVSQFVSAFGEQGAGIFSSIFKKVTELEE